MKPASRYLRWILLLSLAVSLIGGGFSSPNALADCPAGETVTHVTKPCCCGVKCPCGPACCGSNPEKGQQPTMISNQELRDILEVTSAVSCAVRKRPFGQGFSNPTSNFCGGTHAPQTLIMQHTCLQV